MSTQLQEPPVPLSSNREGDITKKSQNKWFAISLVFEFFAVLTFSFPLFLSQEPNSLSDLIQALLFVLASFCLAALLMFLGRKVIKQTFLSRRRKMLIIMTALIGGLPGLILQFFYSS